MLAIVDAVICDTTVTALKRMYCVTSITTLKPHGGMKGSPGENVWYGRTNFVWIRSGVSGHPPFHSYHHRQTLVIGESQLLRSGEGRWTGPPPSRYRGGGLTACTMRTLWIRLTWRKSLPSMDEELVGLNTSRLRTSTAGSPSCPPPPGPSPPGPPPGRPPGPPPPGPSPPGPPPGRPPGPP
ncbi:zinc-finger homeodomain protein 4-like [Gadus morhua]|uniref:zinc-finger homeodomain protein 4-like n=1 Tax=Gadus morhua TaxID=8049 RepID=UPI0011B40AC6|nr:zinc-finger homeodomain protein 4-like [Gadus morhua]